jgi:hypothetical protein
MTNGNELVYSPPYGYETEHGLTKREYFAAMAMQGLLANPDLYLSSETTMQQLSVGYADALINELNKRP